LGKKTPRQNAVVQQCTPAEVTEEESENPQTAWARKYPGRKQWRSSGSSAGGAFDDRKIAADADGQAAFASTVCVAFATELVTQMGQSRLQCGSR